MSHSRTALVLALWALDPIGLGGIWLRARHGPGRDAVLAALPQALAPLHKVHPAIGDDALLGGLDLTATLAKGRRVDQTGVLDRPGNLALSMAERCPAELAAKLAQSLDRGMHGLIALDEGAEADERLAASLADRLAFFLCPDSDSDAPSDLISQKEIEAASRLLPKVAVGPEAITTLTTLAAQLGITSLRPPHFALRAARAHAALAGRTAIEDQDLTIACELVFAHRALPQADAETDAETAAPDQAPQPKDDTSRQEPATAPPEEMLREAVKTALPPEVLAALANGVTTRASGQMGSGAGAAKRGNFRGRPLPARPGNLRAGSRIDLMATLRAAAPWQKLRADASTPTCFHPKIHFRKSDIHLRRFEEKSDRCLILTVDASGSAAMARLGEAKGAVEILLSNAYARRDYIALIAFRGTQADVLLPPTRALVQAKRRLAGLPGGGGTPLASGLEAARTLAMQLRSKGLTPALAVLTDGRANIGLDGSANRLQAAADADRVARVLRAENIPSVMVDTGLRPQATLANLAKTLGARYVPLPRANAGAMVAELSSLGVG